MKTRWMLAGCWLVCGLVANAVVTVENIVALQTPGTKSVVIAYDVASDFSASVEVALKAYDGETELALSSLSGDVGLGVPTGAGNTIVWNAGTDWAGGQSDALRFVVVADDGQGAAPSAVAGAVVVPAGFRAGTDPDFGAFELLLGSDLLVDEMETTKATWDLVYDWAVTNGYAFDNPGSAVSNDHPVTTVNWYDAVKWCNARSQMEGLTPCYTVGGDVYKSGDQVPDLNTAAMGFRLPSSAEWMVAARGGTDTRFPWGDQITHDDATYWSSFDFDYDVSPTLELHPSYPAGTAPAGTFAANGYGVRETSGNAAEWCWDEDDLFGGRFQLGGSWIDGADWLRCGQDFSQVPEQADRYSGFRCVRAAGGASVGTATALVDARDYTLTVVSVGAPASPAAGTHTFAWGAEITCSVDAVVEIDGTRYTSQGWTGTGSVPASGAGTSTDALTLDAVASTIEWHWLVEELNADEDQDGLPDDWEEAFFGSSTSADPAADSDLDGHTNLEEYQLGTDPANAASRFRVALERAASGSTTIACETVIGRTYTVEYTDSLAPPGWKPLATFPGTGAVVENEDAASVDARYYRARVAFDASSVTFEFERPADSDSDGLFDSWEQAFFASATAADPAADGDGDGLSNLEEFGLGTNPTNAASRLNFSVAKRSGGVVISFDTVSTRAYTVQYTESLAPIAWRTLRVFEGTGAPVEAADGTRATIRFYRVQVSSAVGETTYTWTPVEGS